MGGAAAERRSSTHPRLGSAPSPIWQLLVLCGLTGFAFSQPLLAVVGEEPVWFTFRGAGPPEIVAFAVAVVILPPLVLWMVGLLVGVVSRVAALCFHLVAVAILVALTVVQLLGSTANAPRAASAAVAVIAGLIFSMSYARSRTVKLWAGYTCVLPALALGSLVLSSPTGDLVLAHSGPSPRQATAPEDLPSVLLIMLDELPTQSLLDPSGNIDRVRFPNLAALADEGTWYPTYSSTSSFTASAVPSILSGQPPTADPPTYTSHPQNLFSLLAPTHQLHAAETATALCDPDLCDRITSDASAGGVSVLRTLLADGTRVLQRRVSGSESDGAFADFEVELETDVQEQVQDEWLHVRARPAPLDDIVTTMREASGPTLWFAHVMLPHQPWVLYPNGTRYQLPSGMDDQFRNSSDRWLTAVAEQRHLMQLQYTDALVGGVLDALQRSGHDEDTVVVVTADHGVSLMPGTAKRWATRPTMDRLAYVPLIIRAPGGEPIPADGSNIVSDDLLPTIAALVGVDVPWDLPGHVIASAPQERRGPVKELYDFGNNIQPHFEGVLELDMRERVPTFSGRLVGAIEAGETPIAGLLDLVGARPWVGRSLDDVAVGTADIRAEIDSERTLREPGQVPPGAVVVQLTGRVRAEDVLLLEINGSIVTAAPVVAGGSGPATAYALLPPGSLTRSGNAVELALLRDGSVLRVGS